MKNKNLMRIIAMCILIAMLANTALGLGMTPAFKEIKYTPGENQTIEFTVINNEHRTLTLNVGSLGELAEYVTIDPHQLEFDEEEREKTVRVTINPPKNLDPGDRTVKIKISEFIPNVQIGENYINIKLEITSKITVQVPYPEKYVLVKLSINPNENEEIEVKATVENLGTKDIKGIKATFGIYNQDDQLQEKEAEETSLDRKLDHIFSETFDAKDFAQGEYTIKAKIEYDDNLVELGRDLTIGEEEVIISDYTKYFVQGRINKFDIEVKNNWNRKIRNAFALIYIDGFDVIKSLAYDLEPLQEKILVSYWDTSDVDKGDYNSNITVHHNDKINFKEGTVHVLDEGEFGARLRLQEPSSLLKNKWILGIIILGILITIINLNWFLFSKRRRKE